MKNIQKILTLVFMMTVLISCNKPSVEKPETSKKVSKQEETQSKPITALKTKIKKSPKLKVKQNANQVELARDLIRRKKYKEAFDLVYPVALEGFADAQILLGVIYEGGIGVPKNYIQAYKWTKKAAEQGHTKAQYNLGCMYQTGRGVHQNYKESFKW